MVTDFHVHCYFVFTYIFHDLTRAYVEVHEQLYIIKTSQKYTTQLVHKTPHFSLSFFDFLNMPSTLCLFLSGFARIGGGVVSLLRSKLAVLLL